jgi:enediyne biosynthesis protein E4
MVAMLRRFGVLSIVLATCYCQSSDLFREVPASESKITWIHENGFSQNRYLPETTGSGVAIFDYNNDGLMDLLFVNSGDSAFYHPGRRLKHALYRNNGDGTFTDVTEQAGINADIYAMGIAIGDFDGDGYEDIFISGYGKCVLYHNNKNGTFTDVTKESGIAPTKWGTSAVWFDYDNDGKLDLFVGEFADYSGLGICSATSSYGGAVQGMPKEQAYYCSPKPFAPAPSHLYHNLGGGHFEDVSASTGITANPGKAWGVVATDVNQDGYMDLFVSNDMMPNFLWMNRAGKKFEDVAIEANVGYSPDGLTRSGMGVDAGDFDNDGIPDLIVDNIDGQFTSLYRNLGGEVFEEENLTTGLAKVTRMLSNWGIRMFDYDNDGWLDVIEVSGHPDDLIDLRHRGVTYREPLVLLRNVAGTKLEDVSEVGGAAFSRNYAGRGLAIGDLNNDGYPDIVFTEVGGPPHILMNTAVSGNQWLGLQLKCKTGNPDAIGAVIRWAIDDRIFKRVKNGGGSFLSSQDPRELLGAGKKQIDWVEIQWPAPSHTTDRIDKPAMNRYLQVTEGEHPVTPKPKQSATLRQTGLLQVSEQETSDSAEMWEQARAALQEGDFAQARNILLRAVKANPRDASLWFHLGVSCSELKDDDQAIKAFEQARALAPRMPDIYMNLGLSYWHKGDLGKAKEAYHAGLLLRPTDSAGLENYSFLLMKTGQYREAIAPLLVMKKDSKLTLPARVALTECYLKTDLPAKAEAETDELIQSGLASPTDLTKLAAILVQDGAPRAAEKLLTNSLALDSKQANAYAALGAIRLGEKQYVEAASSFQHAIALAPESSEYALAFVRTMVSWDRPHDLLIFLTSEESRFGTLPDFQYALAWAYYGVTQFQDAVTVLQKLLGTNPRRQDQIYFLLGNSYLVLGQYEEAEQAYRTAIEINPKEFTYYEAFATVVRREGPQKADDAITKLKLAYQFDSTNARVNLQLALCYESKGQFADAAGLLEKTTQEAPDLKPAHIALARIYSRLGRKSEANHQTQLVREIDEKARKHDTDSDTQTDKGFLEE